MNIINTNERSIILFRILYPIFWNCTIYKCKSCVNLFHLWGVDFLKHDTSQRWDVSTAMGNVTDMSHIITFCLFVLRVKIKKNIYIYMKWFSHLLPTSSYSRLEGIYIVSPKLEESQGKVTTAAPDKIGYVDKLAHVN